MEEGGAGIESFSGTARRRLVCYPVEEIICHNITNLASTTSCRRTVARPRLAASAAIRVASAAVAELAAAEVRRAAAVLAGNPFSGGQKEGKKGVDGEEILHFLGMSEEMFCWMWRICLGLMGIYGVGEDIIGASDVRKLLQWNKVFLTFRSIQ